MTVNTSTNAKYQLMPPLTEEEFTLLKEDIRRRGVQVAVEFDEDGNLLDGHHRVEAWQQLRDEGWVGPQYDQKIVRGLDEDQKKDYVLSLNLKRRHLSAEQKAHLFARLRQAPFNMTLQQIADLANVGVGTVWRHLDGLPDDVRANLAELATVGRDGKVYPAQYTPMERILIPSEKAERDYQSRGYVGQDDSAQITTQHLIVITCDNELHQTEILTELAGRGLNVKAVLS